MNEEDLKKASEIETEFAEDIGLTNDQVIAISVSRNGEPKLVSDVAADMGGRGGNQIVYDRAVDRAPANPGRNHVRDGGIRSPP